MTTFEVEHWREFAPEAAPLFERHWKEIALDQDKIALSIDQVKYQAMDDTGILHILAMRVDGALGGYFLAFILPHTHYQHAGLMAFTDFYWIAPEHRKGMAGARLLKAAENSLIARGVVKAYLSCKAHHDLTALFTALGWKLGDLSFNKTFFSK